MSTLQLSLAIFGGLVLMGVVVYNAWITRRSAPRTARLPEARPMADRAAHEGEPEGALMDSESGPQERIEPVLRDEPVEAVSVREERHPPAAMVQVLSQSMQAPEKRPGLDALIDVIAPLQLDGEVSGDAVIAALPGTRRVGSKPFAVEGLIMDGGEWESPRSGQRYRALQVGVQLANRTGPLNDIEFSEFVVKAQAFADAVGAAPDFPDMRAEVARARELDAFASGHDAQLGLTVRARRSAWSPGYVSQNAARCGFVAGVLPGRMVLPASVAGQAPILSLSYDSQAAMAEDPEQSALRQINLSLEVTHVPRTEQAYVRLRQVALALAEAMDGIITDDAGLALDAATMDRIGNDLQALYDALDSHDLAAGSPQARRLFS